MLCHGITGSHRYLHCFLKRSRPVSFTCTCWLRGLRTCREDFSGVGLWVGGTIPGIHGPKVFVDHAPTPTRPQRFSEHPARGGAQPTATVTGQNTYIRSARCGQIHGVPGEPSSAAVRVFPILAGHSLMWSRMKKRRPGSRRLRTIPEEAAEGAAARPGSQIARRRLMTSLSNSRHGFLPLNSGDLLGEMQPLPLARCDSVPGTTGDHPALWLAHALSK